MKKSGFTLIELLAVIVVLAIIAFISIPIIVGVVDKAKKGSAIDSAYSYVDAVNNYIALSTLNQKSIIPDDKILESGDDDDILDSINIKGNMPDYVSIRFNDDNNIKLINFCIDNYNITYANNKAEITKTDYCKLANVKEFEIINNVSYMFEGATLQLEYEIIPSDVIPEFISSDESVATVSETGLITAKAVANFSITVKAGIKRKKIDFVVKPVDSLLVYADATKQDDIVKDVTLNGEQYSTHLYYFEGNQVWDSDKKFGDDADVATSSTEANNMVIVKVNGDLTINSGVTIQPYYNSYGGPKGFILYVTGTLTNNGIIDNSHGAKAKGQMVYLWKNSDDSYEYIPVTGGLGGSSVYSTSGKKTGGAGIAGTNRQTGGGAGGGAYTYGSGAATSGAGAIGTSYSGGAGGGGAYGSGSNKRTAGAGAANGGAGGAGTWNDSGNSAGAGNPSGGTGGLLVVYANQIINNGTIQANGAKGYNASGSSGGGSGAGSVNIFYNKLFTNGSTITATGGAGGTSGGLGGKGGNGSIISGSIATGSFVKDE